MSQSPPSTFYGTHDTAVLTDHPSGDSRHSTLPKSLKKETSSPTLSVKSLTLKPTSPRLAKVKFGSSPSNMYRMDEVRDIPLQTGNIDYLVAVHRKQSRLDAYFLSSQRSKPTLFGVPLLVGVCDGLSGRELYARVWRQVARLLSARPPAPAHRNHAADCDDSLGYEFPFTLRAVCRGGAWCAACPWPALCRGCALPPHTLPLIYGCTAETRTHTDDQQQADAHTDGGGGGGGGWLRRLVLGARGVQLAVDWEPTALHLRYQSSREQACAEHASVAAQRGEAARAVDLASCLRAFTAAEALEQRYHCARCRCHQPATKKLQIWRLPPVLIIHLKRFQYVNNKWIKSQKVVNFPFHDFDPTAYLASVPQETILRHQEAQSRLIDQHIEESDSDDDVTTPHDTPPKTQARAGVGAGAEAGARRRSRLQSSSMAHWRREDYHHHRLLPAYDPFHLRYQLYAVVSHSGQLHGGHYVSYARNPSGVWVCYNDSACRPLGAAPALDPAAAYLLFYQREGLSDLAYLPAAPPRPPPAPPADTDPNNMCVLA